MRAQRRPAPTRSASLQELQSPLSRGRQAGGRRAAGGPAAGPAARGMVAVGEGATRPGRRRSEGSRPTSTPAPGTRIHTGTCRRRGPRTRRPRAGAATGPGRHGRVRGRGEPPPRPATRPGRPSRWRRILPAPVLLSGKHCHISKRHRSERFRPAGRTVLAINPTLIRTAGGPAMRLAGAGVARRPVCENGPPHGPEPQARHPPHRRSDRRAASGDGAGLHELRRRARRADRVPAAQAGPARSHVHPGRHGARRLGAAAGQALLFRVRDPKLHVSVPVRYTGEVPDPFAAGPRRPGRRPEGRFDRLGRRSPNSLTTKCPSKYQAASASY